MADKDKKKYGIYMKSKKINDASEKKTDNKILSPDKAINELDKIAAKQMDDMAEVKKISSSLNNMLEPKTMGLPEQALFKNREIEIFNDNVLRMVGKTGKGGKEEIEDVLKAKIEQQNSAVSMYTNTGVYARIIQSRQNRFMEDNMPSLKVSAELFVDDVCNGSYRGSEYGEHNKFKFFKRGVEITDTLEIDKMINILNPTSYTNLMSGAKSFDDIDSSSDYVSLRDGRSFLWVIEHKEVAKDLYLKYVAKEIKRKTNKSKIRAKKAVKASSVEALDAINIFLESSGFKVTMESDLSECLPSKLFNGIPEKYTVEKVDYYSGESRIDDFTYNEYNKTESFVRFAERYLSGDCHRIYEMRTGEKIKSFTYETQGYSDEVAQNVMSQIYKLDMDTTFSLESTNEIVNSFSPITALDKNASKLSELVTFDDIYDTKLSLIANHNDLGTLGKTNQVTLESSNATFSDVQLRTAAPGSVAEKYFLSVLRHVDSVSRVGMETPLAGSFDNTLRASLGKVQVQPDGSLIDADTTYDDQSLIDAEAKAKRDRISRSKLDKMFGGIKGETVVLLDNTRVVPNMAGDRCIGVYYIEYTHQDVQHYIGLRSVLGNPISYTQNIDMLNIDLEQQEETIGRLIFSDTIKPLLEKNMDTKFLKNNSNILYTLKKLMDENDLSNSMSLADATRMGIYNLSRIIYIPSTELVFKRNGGEGLGESLFNKAIVPATACILAKESYLSWILCDGKGYTFITIPRGMSEMSGEYGTEPLRDTLDNIRLSRTKLRDIAFNNAPLTRNIMTMVKGEEAEGSIEIQDIDPPDFEIDQDIIRSWEEEATSIVGYSAALFQSRDGQIELAKKLFEINDSVLIRIIKARKDKKIPSSQLATKLLHARGGEGYNDVTVEWVEPPIEKTNNQKRSEMINEYKETLNNALEIYDTVYGETEDYEAIKSFVARQLVKEIVESDKLILGMEDIISKAKDMAAVETTKLVSEAEYDEKNKEEQEEKKANQDPDNPFAEKNLEEDEEEK